MARKKKQKTDKVEVLEPQISEEIAEEIQDIEDEVKEEVKEVEEVLDAVKDEVVLKQQTSSVIHENKMTIEDAARRFVVNFKPSWLPGIKSFAEKQFRLTGLLTESQCKSILRAWGAKLH